MTSIRHLSLTLLAAAALAGCSSIPADNAMLVQARSAYSAAQSDGQTQTLAPAELKQAGDALAQADAALARRDDSKVIDHLAYITTQRVTLARQVGDRKASEAAVADAAAQRDKMRLAARTREADAATLTAEAAQRDARNALQQTEAARRQAAASQQQASDAEQRSRELQAQLVALDAKKTARGMVITIGDLLFDTNQAELKSGSRQNIQRLSDFLKQNPQRKAEIGGYTDSTGSDSTNQALSGRRAESVRTALLNMGVVAGQLSAQGFGESYPVAGNDNAGGRQMNRRVEIVLSDENGVVAPR